MVPWNSSLGGFAYNSQTKWVGIIAIKTEKNKHQTRNCSLPFGGAGFCDKQRMDEKRREKEEKGKEEKKRGFKM